MAIRLGEWPDSRLVAMRGSQLVEILPGTSGRSKPFSLIYPQHRRLSAACRALIDSLVLAANRIQSALT